MQDNEHIKLPVNYPDHGEVLKVMRETLAALEAPGMAFEHPGDSKVAALYVSLGLYSKHLLAHFEGLLGALGARLKDELETTRKLRHEAAEDEQALARHIWALQDQIWLIEHPGEPVPEHPADPTPF